MLGRATPSSAGSQFRSKCCFFRLECSKFGIESQARLQGWRWISDGEPSGYQGSRNSFEIFDGRKKLGIEFKARLQSRMEIVASKAGLAVEEKFFDCLTG